MMALIIMRWPTGKSAFQCIGSKVQTFLEFTDEGSEFVFSGLVDVKKGVFDRPVFAFKVRL